MNVVMRSVQSIRPADWNVRTDHDLDGIAESIRVNGFRDPIEVWASTNGKPNDPPHEIVVGEGRYRAAVEVVGMTEVPVVGHDFADLDAAKRYSIANNRLTDKSGFDSPRLLAQLEALPELDGTGFKLEDLDELRGMPGEKDLLTDDDEVPEEQAEVITLPGDLWVMGEHRLLCGDATSAEHVERVMLGVVPVMMVTDPPYGVNYDPAWRQREAEKGNLAYAAIRVGVVTNDDRTDWSDAYKLFHGDVAYCWSPPGSNSIEAGMALRIAEFDVRYMLIWAKPHFPIGRGNYHWRHEPCWYAVRRGATAHWVGDRKQTTVWEIALDRNVEGGHSTQKPLECMARAIRNHDAPEVYDPFVGSGTTIIAAEKLGRRCYAMEIEPRYVDVAVRRWMNATGGQAVREGDGFEFPRD